MNKYQIYAQFKTLLPYFWLAACVIVFYRAVTSIDFFLRFFLQVWNIISPFFYGFILAYIFNMPCSFIMRQLNKYGNNFIKKRQKLLSILIVFLIIILLIGIVLNIIVPAIITSVIFFIDNTPTYIEGIFGFVEYFNNLGLFGWYISPEGIFSVLASALEGLSMETFAQPFNAIMNIGSTIFTGFIAIISSIYILVEKDRFKKFLHRLLNAFSPKMFNIAVVEIGARLNKYFRLYINTQTIDGIILGTMATIFLTFVIRSPYALVLGIMLGIVNYVPYFGSIFGTFAAAVVVLLTQDFTMGAGTLLGLIILQQIDANIIQPRLMSDSFSLSPLLIIISITIGGAIAGIFGMLAAIPIVAVLKDIFDSIVEYYEKAK